MLLAQRFTAFCDHKESEIVVAVVRRVIVTVFNFWLSIENLIRI